MKFQVYQIHQKKILLEEFFHYKCIHYNVYSFRRFISILINHRQDCASKVKEVQVGHQTSTILHRAQGSV